MKHRKSALRMILGIVAAVALVAACDTFGPDAPIELSTQPSATLTDQVENTPGEFTWESFQQDGIRVTGTASSQTLVELQAVQVVGGSAVTSTSSPVREVTVADLDEGVPGDHWVPGDSWFPGSQWFPGSEWFPGSKWSPGSVIAENLGSVAPNDQAVSEAVISELGSGANAVIVYAHGPGVAATRPFAIGLNETVTADLQAAPSSSLQNLGPSDFLWSTFQNEIVVSGTASTSIDVELRAIHIEGGSVAQNAASVAVNVSPEELQNGIPGSDWIPSTEWVPGDHWFPGSSWEPEAYVTDNLGTPAPNQSAVVDAVLPALTGTYGSSVNAVIVYTAGPEVDTAAPFALVMQEQS